MNAVIPEKILTAKEMQAADRATFDRIGVPSRAVMESAGRQVLAYVLSAFPAETSRGVAVFAGAGNNGGDGYVIARGLLGVGVRTVLVALRPSAELSGDCLANAQAWNNAGGLTIDCGPDSWQPAVDQVLGGGFGILVDAIYGTGFHGPLAGHFKSVIDAINASQLPVVAVDLPSGVEADTGAAAGAIKATATVCLQALKLGNVLFPGTENCGTLVCADIGIPLDLPEVAGIPRELITRAMIKAELQTHLPRGNQSHKGTRGHVAVVGGSSGHYGAPKLSAQAALRSGAGLVTLAVPESVALVLAPTLTEIMCSSLPSDGTGNFTSLANQTDLQILDRLLEGKSAVVLGPGIGQTEGTRDLVKAVLQAVKDRQIPTVIDADALNAIAVDSELKGLLGAWTVLTPHPGEMARIAGVSTERVQNERVAVATDFAKGHATWVILKGARTIVASPAGEVWINPAANSVLGTGGSGDVLAGIVGALLAARMPVRSAACCAVFLHAAAVLPELIDGPTPSGGPLDPPPFGIIAGDIAFALPQAVQKLCDFADPERTLLRTIFPQ